jgi:plasmid maintenance system killer protein
MWHIKEHRGIDIMCRKLPAAVVKKYELWKNIVFRHGPEKLRNFKGFHDEKLSGKQKGQRSSRLSLQYRVIHTVEQDMVTVLVLEITPHKYLR